MKDQSPHILSLKLLIKNIYGKDTARIYNPKFVGEHHPIYIVEHYGHKEIFRLSTKACAHRNYKVSRLLIKYGIPVPNIKFYTINGKYFENYPFIEGKTLYERHQEGISDETIKKIYTQLCDICYRMSTIPTKEAKDIKLHFCKTDWFFAILNRSPRVIGHCDLNDKNILLNKDDNICAILDLDEVNLKTLELVLIHVFETAQDKGYAYNVESIKDFFPSKYHDDAFINLTNQNKIYKNIVNIKNKLLNIKQILKVRIK